MIFILALLLDTSGLGQTLVEKTYDVEALVFKDNFEILSCLIDPMHHRNHGLYLDTETEFKKRVGYAIWDCGWWKPDGRSVSIFECKMTVKAKEYEHRKILRFIQLETLRRLADRGGM